MQVMKSPLFSYSTLLGSEVLPHRVFRPRMCRSLIRRLSDGAVEGDDRVDIVLAQRLAPGGHEGGFPHRAPAQGDDVAQEIVTERIERGTVVGEWRRGVEVRTVGRPRRSCIRVAPDAVLVEHPLALRLLIVEGN